ncbi:MAG: LPS export ABC transporter periplasmic protein LptC, partial [Lysobacter sp.]
MNWRGLVTVLLLVAAAISGWALWNQRKKDNALTVPTGRADYVLEDFELVALDEQGLEAFTLRAPRLARDPNSKTMDIVTPLFLIPPRAGSQGQPWEVRAKTGWVS